MVHATQSHYYVIAEARVNVQSSLITPAAFQSLVPLSQPQEQDPQN